MKQKIVGVNYNNNFMTHMLLFFHSYAVITSGRGTLNPDSFIIYNSVKLTTTSINLCNYLEHAIQLIAMVNWYKS